MMKRILYISLLLITTVANAQLKKSLPYLEVSKDGHYLQTDNGEPFFWLGDTGWLLMQKLNRQDVDKYLDDRKAKGFNVIQMMVLHDVKDVNYYKDKALIDGNIVAPYMTNGKKFSDYIQFDYWDNVEKAVDECAERGMYAAIVPLWGSVVKGVEPSKAMIRIYMNLLCRRLSNRSNVIWLTGGDIRGDEFPDLWKEMAEAAKLHNPKQLVTFHPRGRTKSSTWFHSDKWLDFNMVQSGHKDYEQDPTGYGEDNWRYIAEDYNLSPAKPVLDAEPSYEGIPRGLHDSVKPVWTDNDVRRYAYWSVFSGACGFTYGNNSVMQFYRKRDKEASFRAEKEWLTAINDPGASEMHHLKELMLSKPYFERQPDQSMIIGPNGEKYDYVVATRGKDYAFVYTYTGRAFVLNTTVLKSSKLKSSWFNPRNGQYIDSVIIDSDSEVSFDPPGEVAEGNDWVLVLEED